MDESTLIQLDDATVLTLRTAERTKLGILATQASKFSSGYVPVNLTTQMQDCLTTLTQINAELAKRGLQAPDPELATITQNLHRYGEQRVTARNDSEVSDIEQTRDDHGSQIVEADNSVIRGVMQRSTTASTKGD